MSAFEIISAIALGLVVGYFIVNKGSYNYSTIHVINKDDFFANMRKGQLVDIRKKKDFEAGHIKGARNMASSEIGSKYSKLRKDLSVYAYCEYGTKSRKAAKKWIRNGFTDIYILNGGYDSVK